MRRGYLYALSVLAAGAIGLSTSARAAEGPLGIGFVQAEEGTWWCQAMAAGSALDCARQKCEAESGGQECHATRWCFPAGWSALMVVFLPEFHSTHALCGMPGPQAATAAMKAICDAGVEFTQCDLVLTIDPDGNQNEDVGITWPGPAAAAPASP
jgi:hypothetical protein